MAIITGTNNGETLTGTANPDTIKGLGGNDTLNGLDGNDVMEGGQGDDVYIVEDWGDQTVELEGEGTDEVRTVRSTWTLAANVERLIYTGAQNGAFSGFGNALNNYIEGWHGADFLNGGLGADEMKGYGGDDTYVVDNAGDLVVEGVGAGFDRIDTTLTAYTLPANVERLVYTGNPSLAFTGTGNAGFNRIEGADGNDILDGAGGGDLLVGGKGNDFYVFRNASDEASENAGEGTDSVYVTLASWTLGPNLENLNYIGPVGAAFEGYGNELNNTITGGSGNDKLSGAAGNDVLVGNGGNDTLTGGPGNDIMLGGSGNDLYNVEDAQDSVGEAAGEGTDQVWTTLTSYILPANTENLVYAGNMLLAFTGTGNELSNHIIGWNGDDLLDGLAGADTMAGKDGSDRYWVDEEGDVVVENFDEGYDRVFATGAAYTLPAHVERLVYAGPALQDFTGTGNGLANMLVGGAGNDTLNGAGGPDTMVGAAGNDTYTVDDGSDDVVELAGEGNDTVLTTLASYTLGSNVENLDHFSIFIVNFTGTGNALDNLIKGGAGNDKLDGKAGTDTLVGEGGNDTYYVDTAADVVIEAAGAGTDTVRSDATSYTLPDHVEILLFTGTANLDFTGIGNALSNSITGFDGNDTLDGKGGADAMVGLWGDDTYHVDDAGDFVDEELNEGYDTVRTTLAVYALAANVEQLLYEGPANAGFTGTGNALNNRIEGWSGNDKLDGGPGADLLIGKNGDDTYWVDDAGDTVVELAGFGIDTVGTTLSSYTLGANVEKLWFLITNGASFTGTGNELDNYIHAQAGNDTLDGKGGADTMVGGKGDDTFWADQSTDIAFEYAGEGNDTVRSTAAFYTLGANVENLLYFGPSLADFTGSGNSLANYIEGWNGNDTLDGKAGADTMKGFAGNDLYVVDDMGDTVLEDALGGIDEVSTALGSRIDFALMYVLPAHVEKLTGTSAAGQGVYGNAGDNTISMAGGSDLIVLHDGGDDKVNGGAGDDFIYFGNAFTTADSVDGGAGYDAVGLLGDYVLTFGADDLVNVEKLAVYSSGGMGTNDYNLTTVDANVGAGKQLMVVAMSLTANEALVFNGSAETNGSFNVRGGKGADTITGSAGVDLLFGNLGADTLKGGGGNDWFDYYDVAESTTAAQDKILDFTLGDRINLKGIDADGNAANGNSKFVFIGSNAFTAAGQLRAVQINNGWLVEGDVNGDGVADLSILVTTVNNHALSAADFLL